MCFVDLQFAGWKKDWISMCQKQHICRVDAGIVCSTLFMVLSLPNSLLASPKSAPASFRDFSRYQIIIDKEVFGKPISKTEERSESHPKPMDDRENFFKGIRLVFMNKVNGVVSHVSFVNVADKNRIYYMKVGETEDGITLVSADYVAEEVVLRKGELECVVTMRGEMLSAGTTAPGAAIRPDLPFSAAGATPPHPATIRISYRDWRRQAQAAADERLRKQAEAQAEAHARISPEEQERLLQDYQKKLIKARGEDGPPLPVPLTEETDNELVAGGFLPPRQPDQPPVTDTEAR
ncbi:MAG: hypothetical protein C0404_11455 [Verrucomicrobia bacterium]|nr:hypothetical protein [Verrucomicrobiota bacterium]